MSWFSDLFTNGAAKDAAAYRVQGYNQGYEKASSALTGGKNEALGYLGQSNNNWNALSGKANAGLDMYGNAMGLNGAAGTQTAHNAFREGPGYQFAVDQGLQALSRARAAGGMSVSGNADADAMKFATGQANQEYNNWRQGFSPYFSLAGTAAAGQSSVLGSMANTATNYGTQMADYGWRQATGTGDAYAAAELARQQAAANGLGAIFSGFKLGSQMFGYGG